MKFFFRHLPHLPIFFRYLFLRLLHPFATCLAACTVIWVMADLYGNMDDFLDHKVGFGLVFHFYALQIPRMLVQVLPATMLFATLFTLLALNRRSELVALQSGGMAPIWMFSPFILFAVIWTGILAYDLSGPAPLAEVTRERLIKEVKGESAGKGVMQNLPYVDTVNHLVWFFSELNTSRGHAKGMELHQVDANGNDRVEYFAQEGQWTGAFWRLTGVKKVVYGPDGEVLNQKTFDTLDLPDVTTPPKQLSLIISQPDQLTNKQLSQYIADDTGSADHLAGYRTEQWYRRFYPLSLLVLVMFALSQGTRTDRRSAVAGLGLAIAVFIGFTIVTGFFMAMGRHNRLPPTVAASAAEVIFGLVGLYLLAVNNGWWWQLHELWKDWYESDDDDEEPRKKDRHVRLK
jgi:lipopolysaccharide export system permease protein